MRYLVLTTLSVLSAALVSCSSAGRTDSSAAVKKELLRREVIARAKKEAVTMTFIAQETAKVRRLIFNQAVESLVVEAGMHLPLTVSNEIMEMAVNCKKQEDQYLAYASSFNSLALRAQTEDPARILEEIDIAFWQAAADYRAGNDRLMLMRNSAKQKFQQLKEMSKAKFARSLTPAERLGVLFAIKLFWNCDTIISCQKGNSSSLTGRTGWGKPLRRRF